MHQMPINFSILARFVKHAFMIHHSMYYGNMLKAIIASEFIRFIFCDSAQKYKLFDLKKMSNS